MAEPARITLPAVSLASLVSREVPFPRVVHVRRRQDPTGPPLDVPGTIRRELADLLAVVRPGDSVAIGVGSRGVARIGEIVTEVVAVLVAHGARPYLVPAMGSHGGATPAGQLAVLADLGIVGERLGVEVRAEMDTRVVGTVGDLTVHTAEALTGADHVIVVNRLKSHTSFSGSVESGLAKMVAIGLGKQRGAEELHRLGPLHLEARIRAACDLLARSLPLRGGLAVVEDRSKGLDLIELVPGVEIGGSREAALLDRARAQEARLPFAQVDVVVVDAMGKEISGTGMDTHVLGRRMVRGSPEPPGVDITNVVVLGVTPGSEGNAVGLGLADFAPVSALEGVDLRATYANALTAGLQGVQRAQVPIVLATDQDAVAAAVLTAGIPDLADVRLARIRSTLALDELLVTRNLITPDSGLEAVGDGADLALFDAAGAIAPWPAAPPREAHP